MNLILFGILLVFTVGVGILLTFVLRSIFPLASYNSTLLPSTRVFLILIALGLLFSGIMIITQSESLSEKEIRETPINIIY